MTKEAAVKLLLQKLPHFVQEPSRASSGSAGLDLYAAIKQDQQVVIKPGERATIPLGFCMALEADYQAEVRSRSGLAKNHGIVVLNSPGTIDSDYRGEVAVLLINHGTEAFKVTRGMRIAQLVISRVYNSEIVIVDTLPISQERGGGGFGSTGL